MMPVQLYNFDKRYVPQKANLKTYSYAANKRTLPLPFLSILLLASPFLHPSFLPLAPFLHFLYATPSLNEQQRKEMIKIILTNGQKKTTTSQKVWLPSQL